MVSRSNGTSQLVLVVDDEEPILALTRRILERHGFLVMTAGDGKEAIETLRDHSHEIGLVLLDVNMPFMNGEETVKELKDINQKIHILLSSGYCEEEIQSRFSSELIDGFVQKPYKMHDLVEIVRLHSEKKDSSRDTDEKSKERVSGKPSNSG